ncbi:helix-turn-helix transcriptional regulator [Deinococcus antarcticus]|uniref:Helix-turn-helix transcriptional regulator n=1 Tax=Deinococcus antarcticus TaxID=1298767 RepID=A0ABV8AC27_9DEIO
MSITRKRSQGPRLLRHIRLLQNEVLTSAQLAERLECTQQEIQRAHRLLRAEGWNVQETGRPRRYFLTPEPAADNDPVSSVITHALLRMLHHHAPTPSRLYHRAALELSQSLPERLRNQVPLDTPQGDTPRILEILATAWCWGQAVEFSYLKPDEQQPKRSVGDVVFMEINRTNLDWYVFIRRRGEEQVKTFHLSRFVDAQRRQDDLSPPIPFDPRDELDGAWGIIGGREHCEITLRFAPDAVRYVVHRHWPGQLSGRFEGDAYLLTVRAPLNHQKLPLEVLAWIRSWGPRVEVVGPESVRTLWLAEARELVAKYSTT